MAALENIGNLDTRKFYTMTEGEGILDGIPLVYAIGRITTMFQWKIITEILETIVIIAEDSAEAKVKWAMFQVGEIEPKEIYIKGWGKVIGLE